MGGFYPAMSWATYVRKQQKPTRIQYRYHYVSMKLLTVQLLLYSLALPVVYKNFLGYHKAITFS